MSASAAASAVHSPFRDTIDRPPSVARPLREGLSRLARSLALAAALPSVVLAEQVPASQLQFTAPAGWIRGVDDETKLVTLTPPTGGASITFIASKEFGGTPEQWHDAFWGGLAEDMKERKPPARQRRGEFLTTWGAFDRDDGTQAWFCLYSLVKNGRAEGLLFFADSEARFQQHWDTVNGLVDHIVVAPPDTAGTATAVPPAGAAIAAETPPPAVAANLGPDPAAPLPLLAARLTVGAPPGWSVQPDAKTGAVYMKPPDARTVDEAALVVFPAVDFTGTAEQFHSQTLATAVGTGRLLEPVVPGPPGPLLVSAVHFLTSRGADARLILYTARWGGRAQAIVFAAARADLFQRDSPAANQAVAGITVPGAPEARAASTGPPVTPPAGTSSPPVASAATSAGEFIPVLTYRDPPNFWRAGTGGTSYTEYQGSDVNFTLCVYPFREFQGDVKAAFRQTLLRDWIGIMYREESVAGPVQFGARAVPGADAVMEAHFRDARQQEHHRILIVAGHSAALVDLVAPTLFAWQKGSSPASAMLASMRVDRKPGPPSLAGGPGPQGALLAGLFQGMRGKTVSNLFLGPGHLSTQTALHYFLFSADGRVYRCYDFPPGGSEAAARRFDFDAAGRQDPSNTGRFAVRGNEVYIKMGGPNADEIVATIAGPNELQLEGARYTRQ